MNKPFDLAAAKRGEKVEWNITSGYIPVDFIGMHGSEAIIYGPHGYIPIDVTELRMAQKNVTVRYRVAVLRNSNGYFTLSHIRTSDDEKFTERQAYFAQWGGDWVEIEVPQGDK